MDTRGFHNPPFEPPSPPPPPPPSSIASFPILAISIIGILTTSILLLTYYVFVIKCCLHRHYPDVLLRLSWSRRGGHNMSPPSAASGGGARLGLSESAIRAIPSFRYTKQSDGRAQGQRARECAVCLNEFQEEERVRLLPSCRHVFHIDCVDTWLQSHPNCPLCRSNVTAPLPVDHLMALAPHFDPRRRNEVALQVRDGGGGGGCELIAQVPHKSEQRFRQHKKLEYLTSRGDECIDARRRGDELFCLQPMRRSFSMDSSADRQLHVALQKILQQNGESSSSSTRFRRSFFSFGRSSRGAVLPLQIEQ